MTEYALVLEEADDGGWWAYAPDLPGVVATGDTQEAAQKQFHEALAFHREGLESLGQELPPSRSRGGVVRV